MNLTIPIRGRRIRDDTRYAVLSENMNGETWIKTF